jgi:heat-inducible transcriptional repressor
MAVAPQSSKVNFQHIDFVLVRTGLVMAILIFEGGIIQNKLISVDKKLNSEDLVKYANFLNDKFKGYSILEIKKNILEEMKKAESDFNALYYKAMHLVRDVLKDQDPEREIFLEGTLQVMHKMDFRDISSMRELLEFLEQRSELLEILDKISQVQGLSISFGNDFYGPDLGEWGIISSPYGLKGEPLGVIGTIGPINMDYSKLVPMVDYIAKMLNQILEQRL